MHPLITNHKMFCGEMCSKHDRAYRRWMPHINLLYPFIADDPNGNAFSAACDILTPVLADVAPFQIRFDAESFRFFRHGKNCTLWLKPQSEMSLPSGEILAFSAEVVSTVNFYSASSYASTVLAVVILSICLSHMRGL